MIQLFEYELPFTTPFRTASAEFHTRKGLLIRYRTADTDLVVEASPLPGFSQESFSEVRICLFDQKEKVENYFSQPLNLQKIKDLSTIEDLPFPSIQFGLSFLGLQLLARQEGTTLNELLGVQSPDSLLINDIIGRRPVKEMRAQIEKSIRQGFQVLKVKASYPLDSLVQLLREIHKDYPRVLFRIDGNQSWPQHKLTEISRKLEDLPVEYIEEPCKIEDLTEFHKMKQPFNMPIALDESISSISSLHEALNLFPDFVLIIKPMLIGNILEIHETISNYRSSFKHIVVTTTLESIIGRTMTASTASLIGDPKMRHGLHTGHLLKDDLLPDSEIKNGSSKHLQDSPVFESFKQIKTSFIKQLR